MILFDDLIIFLIKSYLDSSELYTLNNTSNKIKKILNLDYIYPKRLTFIQENTCTICNNHCKNLKLIPTFINYELEGWIPCKNCLSNVLYSKQKYVIDNKIILNNGIINLNKIIKDNNNLCFFRRSINKIQYNCKFFSINNQTLIFNKSNKILSIMIQWFIGNSNRPRSYYREVPILNLIAPMLTIIMMTSLVDRLNKNYSIKK